MKILVAPDSFKGSMSAEEIAENIEKGIKKVYEDAVIYKIPMADGGEGTVNSLVNATKGRIIKKDVTGPLSNKVEAYFGILGTENTAVIEMATASGLHLLPPDQINPLKTTTYGTGELIKAALDEGVEKIIVGLGGSATIDAGVGMAQALGMSFRDIKGNEVDFGGEHLSRINSIDMGKFDARIKKTEFIIASDVSNPLYGFNGAAHVYGPQKGATPAMISFLDKALRNFASVIKKEINIDIKDIQGGGAAGGMGTALSVFFNARIESGVELILNINRFDDYLKLVDLVITGEGKLDTQTLMGKTPIGVAARAKKYNVPVIAIAGSIEEDALKKLNDDNIDAAYSIVQGPVDLDTAVKNTAKWVEITIEQIMRGGRYIKYWN